MTDEAACTALWPTQGGGAVADEGAVLGLGLDAAAGVGKEELAEAGAACSARAGVARS